MFLSNIFNEDLKDVEILLDYANNIVEYHFDRKIYDSDNSFFFSYVRDFSWRMVRYYNILKDFEKEKMLVFYQESLQQNQLKLGRLARDQQYISSQLHDLYFSGLILEYSKKTILINQALVDYVNNDFNTQEDIKHIESTALSQSNLDTALESLALSRKSLKKATTTLIVTIIIFILGTAMNLWIAFRVPPPIKIDSGQLEKILKDQKEIMNSIRKDVHE